MAKRLQNKVAESRFTLPVVAGYGIVVWLLCGLLHQQWWMQFICFILSTYLMVELNNSNALIRIYSRSISSAFIVLSCMACFLFSSTEGAIAQLCLVASLLTSFHTYQDKTAVGWIFYTYLLLGLTSLVSIHALWLVPFYWLIQAFFIYSLSWRTFSASLLGLILPYWFMAAWILWYNEGDFSPFIAHFQQLTDFSLSAFPLSMAVLPLILSAAYLVCLAFTGSIHYFRTSFNDKIRTRQIFYCFMLLNAVATLMLIAQPQHSDLFLRVMIITASPLIAHFISLTNTRITNIAFCAICGITFLLTAFHLWSTSYIF